MSFVAIEGGMCAGKTTVSKALQKRFGFLRLSEYFEMLSQDERLTLESMSSAQRFDFFVGVDRKRTSLMKTNRVVHVADRCIFSILGTDYALWMIGIIPDIKHVVSQLERTVESWPGTIIFLDVNDVTREARHSRRPQPGYAHQFLRRDFNRYFKHFFELLPFSDHVHYVLNEGDVLSTVKQTAKIVSTSRLHNRVHQESALMRLREVLSHKE